LINSDLSFLEVPVLTKSKDLARAQIGESDTSEMKHFKDIF